LGFKRRSKVRLRQQRKLRRDNGHNIHSAIIDRAQNTARAQTTKAPGIFNASIAGVPAGVDFRKK
jgi:hypothetical protein